MYDLKKLEDYLLAIVLNETNFSIYNKLLNLEYPVFLSILNALMENSLTLEDLSNQENFNKIKSFLGISSSLDNTIENALISKLDGKDTANITVFDTTLSSILNFLSNEVINSLIKGDNKLATLVSNPSDLFSSSSAMTIGKDFPISLPTTIEEKELFNQIVLNIRQNTL
jgi:hypothetical protein